MFRPASAVTDTLITMTIKEEVLVLDPAPKPELDGKQSIIAQVDYPPHAVFFSLENMNLSVSDIQIV